MECLYSIPWRVSNNARCLLMQGQKCGGAFSKHPKACTITTHGQLLALGHATWALPVSTREAGLSIRASLCVSASTTRAAHLVPSQRGRCCCCCSKPYKAMPYLSASHQHYCPTGHRTAICSQHGFLFALRSSPPSHQKLR